MTTPPARTHASTGRPARRRHEHRHSKTECLRILRRLSAFLDKELDGDLCQEIRRHLKACPNCDVFLTSLRQTIRLCRKCPPPGGLSPTLKARLRAEILKAIARS